MKEDTQKKKEIISIWNNRILPLYQKHFDIDYYRMHTRLDPSTQLPQLCIELKKKRNSTDDFEVIFRDGTIFSTKKSNGKKLLIDVIQKIGLKDVEHLKIKTIKNLDLISDNTEGLDVDLYTPVSSKYVITKTANTDKYSVLNKIKERLNNNLFELKWIK